MLLNKPIKRFRKGAVIFAAFALTTPEVLGGDRGGLPSSLENLGFEESSNSPAHHVFIVLNASPTFSTLSGVGEDGREEEFNGPKGDDSKTCSALPALNNSLFSAFKPERVDC